MILILSVIEFLGEVPHRLPHTPKIQCVFLHLHWILHQKLFAYSNFPLPCLQLVLHWKFLYTGECFCTKKSVTEVYLHLKCVQIPSAQLVDLSRNDTHLTITQMKILSAPPKHITFLLPTSLWVCYLLPSPQSPLMTVITLTSNECHESVLLTVLVCWGYRYKILQTRWLKQRFFFILQARSLRSSCLQCYFPWRLRGGICPRLCPRFWGFDGNIWHSLACGSFAPISAFHLHMVSSQRVCLCVQNFPFVRVLVIWD